MVLHKGRTMDMQIPASITLSKCDIILFRISWLLTGHLTDMHLIQLAISCQLEDHQLTVKSETRPGKPYQVWA